KKFLFRVIFRGTGWAFAHDNEFKHVSEDPDYWDERIRKFYQKYHVLDEMHRSWVEQVYATGRLEAFTGRFWTFELKEKRDKFGNVKMVAPLNDLTNYPVQGTGNDLMAIVRVTVKNRLTRFEIPGTM